MRETFERELAVFSTVRRLPVAERTAYLDRTCAGESLLRQRVEELLRASENADGFLMDPPRELSDPTAQQLPHRC